MEWVNEQPKSERDRWPNQFMKAVAACCLFNWNAMQYCDTKASHMCSSCHEHEGRDFTTFLCITTVHVKLRSVQKAFFVSSLVHQHELKFIIPMWMLIMASFQGCCRVMWRLRRYRMRNSRSIVEIYFVLFSNVSVRTRTDKNKRVGAFIHPHWMFIKFIQASLFHLPLSLIGWN